VAAVVPVDEHLGVEGAEARRRRTEARDVVGGPVRGEPVDGADAGFDRRADVAQLPAPLVGVIHAGQGADLRVRLEHLPDRSQHVEPALGPIEDDVVLDADEVTAGGVEQPAVAVVARRTAGDVPVAVAQLHLVDRLALSEREQICGDIGRRPVRSDDDLERLPSAIGQRLEAAREGAPQQFQVAVEQHDHAEGWLLAARTVHVPARSCSSPPKR